MKILINFHIQERQCTNQSQSWSSIVYQMIPLKYFHNIFTLFSNLTRPAGKIKTKKKIRSEMDINYLQD